MRVKFKILFLKAERYVGRQNNFRLVKKAKTWASQMVGFWKLPRQKITNPKLPKAMFSQQQIRGRLLDDFVSGDVIIARDSGSCYHIKSDSWMKLILAEADLLFMVDRSYNAYF
ncbi:Uncharacterized protein Adt_26118 [Abeliophyllum distichum]|uniref:Uncharacterized protein n=1 Tax=Abeliophyllum distichum TaxID=126358 RepID=A0ABD1RPZ9_9LAMI